MQSDLNLLRALDALLEEGSVTRAAGREHLSVPAMSRALARLRRTTGDEILVRTGRTMTPTPRAIAMRDEVRSVLDHADRLLEPDLVFDAATLERDFSLRVHDALIGSVGRSMVESIRHVAPSVRLRFLAEMADDTADLRLGRIDLEINAGLESIGSDLHSDTIDEDELVAIARADHPLFRDRISRARRLSRFVEADHVIVSRRGNLLDPIDAALASLGRERRVVATVPTAAAALELVAATALVTVGPRRALSASIDTMGLDSTPLPLDVAPVPIVMSWPRLHDNDPAHIWLRNHARAAINGTTPTDSASR